MTSTNPASSLPVRHAHSRQHSLSVSAGSINPNHRVTRRKSVSSNAVTNSVAIAAAVREIGGEALSATSVSVPLNSRRNTISRTAGPKTGTLSSYPTLPSSLPSHKPTASISIRKQWRSESVIEDDPNEEDELEGIDSTAGFGGSRVRRASEGQYLKGDGKKLHGNELKCEKCGKGYKHSSCLAKHLWEHTPEWSLTSKLLISKHQQVQLLEAASVLVAMNVDSTPPSSAKDFQSDQEESSSSPSGYSDLRDSRQSSADTTPPPTTEYHDDHANRYSSGSAFSRSYQSVSSSGFQQSSQRSSMMSPSLAPISSGDKEEDEGLANAIDLLSCSFGTPQSRVTAMPMDVPPVPPLPAQYASSSAIQNGLPNGSIPLVDQSQTGHSYAVSERYHNYAASDRYHHSYDDRSPPDVKMEDGDDSVIDDDDYERRSRGRSDEDDEGVFGRMDE